MHKSFESLCALIEEHFREAITSGSFFVFINRIGDRMKVLYFDGDGFVIWYKRLERGRFVRRGDVVLTRREFIMLLEGIEPKRLRREYRLNSL